MSEKSVCQRCGGSRKDPEHEGPCGECDFAGAGHLLGFSGSLETAEDPVVHKSSVAPGLRPGGTWTRLCTSTKLLREGPLNDGNAAELGEKDGNLAVEALERGERCWLYIYDGDTGECVKTIVAITTFEGVRFI